MSTYKNCNVFFHGEIRKVSILIWTDAQCSRQGFGTMSILPPALKLNA